MIHLTFNAVVVASGAARSFSHEAKSATFERLACTWEPVEDESFIGGGTFHLERKAARVVSCPACLVLLDEALAVTEGAS